MWSHPVECLGGRVDGGLRGGRALDPAREKIHKDLAAVGAAVLLEPRAARLQSGKTRGPHKRGSRGARWTVGLFGSWELRGSWGHLVREGGTHGPEDVHVTTLHVCVFVCVNEEKERGLDRGCARG